MPPERDSQRCENDGQKEESGLAHQPESESAAHLKRRPKGRHSATEMGKRVRSIGALGMIPILLGVGPIIGLFIGQWLDQKFGSSPWLTVLFVILGFVAAVREMIQLLKRYSDEDNRKDKKDKSAQLESDDERQSVTNDPDRDENRRAD